MTGNAARRIGGCPRDRALDAAEHDTHLARELLRGGRCVPVQLFSSFAEIRDSVLPPTPDDIWAENVARVVGALG